MPLSHSPGHAQADFGEADAIIGGIQYRAHYFVMSLPHSDACFVAAYPAATTEAWLALKPDAGFKVMCDQLSGEDRQRLFANSLCHEMIHAIVGLKQGHGGAFRTLALAMGLLSPMKSTPSGPLFFCALATCHTHEWR